MEIACDMAEVATCTALRASEAPLSIQSSLTDPEATAAAMPRGVLPASACEAALVKMLGSAETMAVPCTDRTAFSPATTALLTRHTGLSRGAQRHHAPPVGRRTIIHTDLHEVMW
jgi:hypothetical protein